MIEGLGRTCADDFSEHSVAMEKCGRYLNANFISIIGGKVTHHVQETEAFRMFMAPKEVTSEATIVPLPQSEIPDTLHAVA